MYVYLYSYICVLIFFGLINFLFYYYMCVFYVDEVDKRVLLYFMKDERIW